MEQLIIERVREREHELIHFSKTTSQTVIRINLCQLIVLKEAQEKENFTI